MRELALSGDVRKPANVFESRLGGLPIVPHQIHERREVALHGLSQRFSCGNLRIEFCLPSGAEHFVHRLGHNLVIELLAAIEVAHIDILSDGDTR